MIFETITASRACSRSMIISNVHVTTAMTAQICHFKFPNVILAHVLVEVGIFIQFR